MSTTNEQAIEAEIQAKGLTALRVTSEDVAAEIAAEFYVTAENGLWGAAYASAHPTSANLNPVGTFQDGKGGQIPIAAGGDLQQCFPPSLAQVTICTLILRNGTKIVGVNTGPVSPKNFDAELARKLARQHAIDQMWPLLGYALRERLAVATPPKALPVQGGISHWSRLCALPKFSFITAAGGGVQRVTDKYGNWIEFSEAQRIVDDAEAALIEARQRIADLERYGVAAVKVSVEASQ